MDWGAHFLSVSSRVVVGGGVCSSGDVFLPGFSGMWPRVVVLE